MIKKYAVTGIGLSLLILGNVCHVEAAQFNLGETAVFDIDTELKYAGAWRMKDQNQQLLSEINSDDGNRSFDKYDMINNKFSVIADLDLHYKNVGVFVRPRAFYDFAYDGTNANNSTTNNNAPAYGGPLSASNEFMSETKDRHRDTVEILDAFVYGNFDLGSTTNLGLRVGSHVVSWGESLYIQNSISSAMSPIDATATNAPGVALKEIFLPVQQASASIDLGGSFSLSGYYQWEWEKSRLNEQGSFFSDADGMDEAGRRNLAGIADVALDKTGYDDAKDSGQFGVGVRYVAEKLDDAEFGLYFINYHDKTPMVVGNAFTGILSPTGQAMGGWGAVSPSLDYVDLYGYEIAYAEDIQLLGASMGTRLGEANVGFEISYRQDVPVAIKSPNLFGFSYESGDAVQVQLSAIRIYGLTAMWDQMTLKGEVGYNKVMNYGDAKLSMDEDAWGGTIDVAADYYQVFKGLDMTPSIQYAFNSGTSSLAASFEDGADSVAFTVDFTYLIDYRFGLTYVDFLGSADDNSLADRDYMGVSFTYMF